MSEVQSNIDYFLEYKELEGLLLSVTDKTKVFRPSNGGWYLKNTNSAGFADIQFNFGQAGDLPVAGDWDGNSTSTIGIYRNGSFYLRNSNTTGFADLVFAFGEVGDQPIAGDWDGVDTIGTYNSSTGVFLLGMSNNAGAATLNFAMGLPGDLPVVGDWNGDGTDTIGVYRPSTGIFYLRNVNDPGFGEIVFSYGGVTGDQPIAGDWNNDGIDTVGVYRSNTFYLKNAYTTGNADLSFALGNPGDLPVAGDWDGLPAPVTPTNTPVPTSTPTRTPTAGPTPTNPPTPTPTPAGVFSSASFTYDGDGKRVKSAMTTNLGTTTTYFIGAHYEVTGSTITKYYYAGAQRIAMRSNGTVFFTLGDHLGSTSLTTFANGTVVSELRYKAWGEVRYASGNTPTQYQYTGQFSYESQFGLYFYNARWYDSSLGRFASADTVIPAPYSSQSYDRFAYGLNNPSRYTDPTGHKACDERDGCTINAKTQARCSVGGGYFNGSFKCTAADLNKVSIAKRKSWLNEMLASVHPDLPLQFANLNSILNAFEHTDTGIPGSWASWGDAGILTSVQNGLARAIDQRYIPGYKPADQAWKNYTVSFFSSPESNITHQLWGAAEGLGTAYGRLLAGENGQSKTLGEVLFLGIGNVYRNSLARYNPDAIQTDVVREITSFVFDPSSTFGDTDITPVQLVAELLLQIK